VERNLLFYRQFWRNFWRESRPAAGTSARPARRGEKPPKTGFIGRRFARSGATETGESAGLLLCRKGVDLLLKVVADVRFALLSRQVHARDECLSGLLEPAGRAERLAQFRERR
jgi:hypothetical protein